MAATVSGLPLAGMPFCEPLTTALHQLPLMPDRRPASRMESLARFRASSRSFPWGGWLMAEIFAYVRNTLRAYRVMSPP